MSLKSYSNTINSVDKGTIFRLNQHLKTNFSCVNRQSTGSPNFHNAPLQVGFQVSTGPDTQLPLLISGIATPYKSHTFRPCHAMASYLAETSNFAPSFSTSRTSLQ
jgi:hypothetical protein